MKGITDYEFLMIAIPVIAMHWTPVQGVLPNV
jgi:hypothetical protein